MQEGGPAIKPHHSAGLLLTRSLTHPFFYLLADGSASWVSAETLWILGRYMVHLPLEEITKISPMEVSREGTLANSPGRGQPAAQGSQVSKKTLGERPQAVSPRLCSSADEPRKGKGCGH